MSQSRKKATTFQKQKIAKAQHRNEFKRKLKFVINAINGNDVFSIISDKILDELYNTRVHSFKIVVPSEFSVPSEIITDFRQLISGWAKKENMTVIPGKLELTVEEFYTVVLTIKINLHRLLNDKLQPHQLHKEKFNKFNEITEKGLKESYEAIYRTLLTLGFYHTDIGKTLYWLNHEIVPTPDLRSGVDNLIIINSCKSESANVVIEEKQRPVLRLGYTFPDFGIEYITIKPSDLKVDNSSGDEPLDVYIQSHALQRLSERVDCYLTGTVHYNLFLSLKDPKVFYFNNTLLIEYRYFDMKAGYLTIEIIDDKVIIRTFLFVTNNGTPEGQMLEKITGLKKLDKKYLALDKLSTFMSSDIGKNEKTKEIFISAGCQCLLDLYEKCHQIATNSSKQFDTNLLLRYIDYDREHHPGSLKYRALHGTKPEIN